MKAKFILIAIMSLTFLMACKKKEGSEKTLVIDFVASKTDITTGDSVTFNPSSNLGPVSFSWNFVGGNPSYSSFPTPTIVYNSVGEYSVTLSITIANNGPSKSLTKQNYIKVH